MIKTCWYCGMRMSTNDQRAMKKVTPKGKRNICIPCISVHYPEELQKSITNEPKHEHSTAGLTASY